MVLHPERQCSQWRIVLQRIGQQQDDHFVVHRQRRPSLRRHLVPQGALVCKVFHGSGYSQLVKLFKETFRVVKPLKPKASRDKSSETFLVGMGLKTRRV